MNADEAKKALAEEQKKRSDECTKEVSAVLEKYNCVISPFKISRPGDADSWGIEIVAKP